MTEQPSRPTSAIASLVQRASRLRPQTVIIAGADRAEDLEIVKAVQDQGFVKRFILVGDASDIAAAQKELGISVPPEDILATTSQEETARRVVDTAQAGGADLILKGNISTPILNREILRLRTQDTISLVTLFEASCIAGGRPILLTDPGVTTVCNYSRMAALIRNAAEVARLVLNNPCPRIALLAANEKVIDSLASTKLAAALTEAAWENMTVYGPLSFDLAVDPESVRLKGVQADSPMAAVAGQADILVCPGIDSANILYKVVMAMAHAGQAALAGVTVGVKVPYVILSRADPVATKVNSVAMCCIYAEGLKQERARKAPQAAPATGRTFRVLAINPGSTSVKVALFANDQCIENAELPHNLPVGLRGDAFDAEVTKLTSLVSDFIAKHPGLQLDAVVGRGGFLQRAGRRIATGTYLVASMHNGRAVVDPRIVRGVRDVPEMDHASNYGIPTAARLAETFNVPAYTVDPVVSDDFDPVAQLSGFAPIQRKSTAHVLSVRAMAAKAAAAIGRPLEKINLVVAHLGGGITVAAVRGGKIVDNNIALLGGGPFTPQRAGALPLNELLDLCYSGRFTQPELVKQLTKQGGLKSYLDEDRVEVIEQRIAAGDEHARLVIEAMAYQISKEIGAMAVAVGEDVEAIVLSGGMSRSKRVVKLIKQRVGSLAPVLVYPENLEMAAMAAGALQVLSGEQSPQHYSTEAVSEVRGNVQSFGSVAAPMSGR